MAKKEALERFHRQAISQAAERLFDLRGIEKTTMDDIAREAEYSKATLYVYFKNKDEIFHTIVLKGWQRLRERYAAVLAGGQGAREAYKALCRELAAFYEERPQYFRALLETVAVDEESRGASPVLAEIYALGEAMNDDMEALIQQGMAEGVFVETANPVATGFLQWGALSGIVELANQKEAYIEARMGLSKREFLQLGFEMMFRAREK